MEIIPLYCLEICQYPQAYKYQISRQKMQDPDGLVIIRVQDPDGTMTATFMMWIDLLVQQSKVKHSFRKPSQLLPFRLLLRLQFAHGFV